MVLIISDQRVFLIVDENCFSFTCEEHRARKVKKFLLECNNAEADTRIIFHITEANPQAKIVIKASDTDIIVIYLAKFKNSFRYKFRWILEASKGRTIPVLTA